MAPKAKGPNKSEFIRQLLRRDPETNLKAVNEAWTKAGYKGGMSSTSLYLIKSQVNSASAKGLAGRVTPDKTTPAKPPTKRSEKTEPARLHASERNVASGSNGGVLDDLEGKIDGLIFKLMGVGGMSDVEEALRQARRLIVRHQG